MLTKEIRLRFLEFFQRYGHTLVPSDGLIPKHDPTLLFTSAGMVQFKDHFLQKINLEYTRAVSCQKCLRTSDIENVGRTARHHTFFEMLGNFSFGDYFKQEAIRWAWQFVTEELHLPKEKLWISIYTDDDESFNFWHTEAGVAANRIVRLGKESNFWQMGETGPCGPCSEILIDQGENVGCRKPNCSPACDCDRFLEFWNLVFTQFDRQADGTLLPLPKKNIDTGMGLERTAAIVQGVRSNFEIDLFRPLIHYIHEFTDIRYGSDAKSDISFRVIADHSRALTFAISEGILPSNEGRGYVIRRILRRAYRHGKLLGIEEPFLYRVAGEVVELMQDTYPDLRTRWQHTSNIILTEEKRFETTLNQGLALLDEWINKLKQTGDTVIPGEIAFKLYDTYGFPLDLTMDIAAENQLTVDQSGFNAELSLQQERARAAWVGSGEQKVSDVYHQIQKQFGDTEFLGYKKEKLHAKLLAIIKNGQIVESAEPHETVELVFDRTPFYAESGGQVGDTGCITKGKGTKAEVSTTVKKVGNSIIHQVNIQKGKVNVGENYLLTVDSEKRYNTARNHTATHLLHTALRRVLGDHVHQSGSLVAADRLRFDFTHYQALTEEELNRVEEIVNQQIQNNLPVKALISSVEEANRLGAIALFGEKYGKLVRVIKVADFSIELCGGIHVARTGDIGLFVIVSSGAVAAGVRRIEAVTGKTAFHYLKKMQRILFDTAELVKSEPDKLYSRIESLVAETKQLHKEIEKLKTQKTSINLESILQSAVETNGIKVIAQKIKDGDQKTLLSITDQLKARLHNSVAVLGSSLADKVYLIALVTKDLTNRVHAGKLIQRIAAIVDGGGGGRPDLAQAGGKNPAKLDEALSQVPEFVKQMMQR
ncbi:MAG: alanine--tRNA ligase [bacterium]|nr:alanine--tRNA ligase [bacterium]